MAPSSSRHATSHATSNSHAPTPTPTPTPTPAKQQSFHTLRKLGSSIFTPFKRKASDREGAAARRPSDREGAAARRPSDREGAAARRPTDRKGAAVRQPQTPHTPAPATPSPSPGTKKRARIAPPESIGREESRRLIQLVDSHIQPSYTHDMVKALEDARKRQQARLVPIPPPDPEHEARDDDEVLSFLQQDTTGSSSSVMPQAGPSHDVEPQRPGPSSARQESQGKPPLSPSPSSRPRSRSQSNTPATALQSQPLTASPRDKAKGKAKAIEDDGHDVVHVNGIAAATTASADATPAADTSMEILDAFQSPPGAGRQRQPLLDDIDVQAQATHIYPPLPPRQQEQPPAQSTTTQARIPAQDAAAQASNALEAIATAAHEFTSVLAPSDAKGQQVSAAKEDTAEDTTEDMTGDRPQYAHVYPPLPYPPVRREEHGQGGHGEQSHEVHAADLDVDVAVTTASQFDVAELRDATEEEQRDDSAPGAVLADDEGESADALMEHLYPLEAEDEPVDAEQQQQQQQQQESAGQMDEDKEEQGGERRPAADAAEEGVAEQTNEIGEIEHVARERTGSADYGVDEAQGDSPPAAPATAPVVVIDFTNEDTSDDDDDEDQEEEEEEEEEDRILIPATRTVEEEVPRSIPRIRSTGILRGPLADAQAPRTPLGRAPLGHTDGAPRASLGHTNSTPSRIPRAIRSPAPTTTTTTTTTRNEDVVDLVRGIGRTSLATPSRSMATAAAGTASSSASRAGSLAPSTAANNQRIDMTYVFSNQRYSRPSLSKREHILRDEHLKQKKALRTAALKQQRVHPAVHMPRSSLAHSTQSTTAPVYDPQGLLEYRRRVASLLGGRDSTVGQGASSASSAAVTARTTSRTLQRSFYQQLGKSRASESRIPIRPGKEQLRLRREERRKERLRRGVLGRRPLPATLTPEQEAAVEAVLADQAWKASLPGASASWRDLWKLRPGQWMNDETITFYMTMINQRSALAESERAKPQHDAAWRAFYRVHAFNSYFWAKLDTAGFSSVSRWTRRVDVFRKDVVLVPVNLNNSHWTCAAINFRRRRFEYYDSMGGENARVLSKLREYVKKEMEDKKKVGVVDLNEFTDYYASDSSPQQRNGYDCGVFVCATLEQLSRRDPRAAFEEDPVLELPSSEDEDERSEDEDEGRGGGGGGGGRGGGYGSGGARARARLPRRGLDGYEWNFSQGDMPYLRRRIICEVARKGLLD